MNRFFSEVQVWGMSGVEASTQTSMVLHGLIDNIGKVFELIQVKYNDGSLSVAEARDSVTMLLGELFQLASFIKEMDGDGEVETITDLEHTMKAYPAELAQALAHSAVKTRATEKKTEMQELLGVWFDYEERTIAATV